MNWVIKAISKTLIIKISHISWGVTTKAFKVYVKESKDLDKTAYKGRKINYRKNENNMIEVTQDTNAAIDSILRCNSYNNYN